MLQVQRSLSYLISLCFMRLVLLTCVNAKGKEDMFSQMTRSRSEKVLCGGPAWWKKQQGKCNNVSKKMPQISEGNPMKYKKAQQNILETWADDAECTWKRKKKELLIGTGDVKIAALAPPVKGGDVESCSNTKATSSPFRRGTNRIVAAISATQSSHVVELTKFALLVR